MRLRGPILGSILLALPAAAMAQIDAPSRVKSDGAIVVTGKRLTENGKPIPMSDWRVAETEHVVYYSRDGEKQVARTVRNLERLHFLLSILLNRVGREDPTLKLSVIQIGDTADFENLRLGNARSQEGPYPVIFPTQLYYDPRDDGAVLATTHQDQNIVLEQGRDLSTLGNITVQENGQGSTSMVNSVAGASGSVETTAVNELRLPVTAEGRLYAGFARHFLLTYFPAAYPRWYLDGFGQMFSTLAADQDGVIEYGRLPEGFRKIIERFGSYRVTDLLNDRYLGQKRSQTDWTPYHAWSLVHLLFFSDEWKQPLHAYLGAIARGASPQEAAAALGDTGKLQNEWSLYRGRKVPFEKLTYPAGRFGDPLVRQLTRDQADFVQRRLVLGPRVEIAAATAGPERAEAVQTRAKWAADLARDAAADPRRLDLQLLAAEGACRSEAWSDCRTAADRALALDANNGTALAWKGVALAGLSAALPETARSGQLSQARSLIARANKADTEAILPLLAYHRSFLAAGLAPPDLALLGLVKASSGVPAAPETRLMLGEGLARRGNSEEARSALLPVARGPYDTPEKPRAAEILVELPKGDAKPGSGSGPGSAEAHP